MAKRINVEEELKLGGGTVLPKRGDLPKKYCWNLEDIYCDINAWEQDFEFVEKEIPKLAKYSGKLNSAKNLLEFFTERDNAEITLGKLVVFANMRSHEDTADSKYQALVNRISALSVRYSAAISFVTPELLALPEETLKSFAAVAELQDYSFGLKELLRQKKHILSVAEENILAQTAEFSDTADNTFSMLTNADMCFEPIKNEMGLTVEMSEERAVSYLRSRSRNVRRAAFNSLYKPYCEMKNTLGATFNGMLKAAQFYARVRKYASPLEAALDAHNVPVSVYDNLVSAIENNLQPMYRYLLLRKQRLKLKELHTYDLYTPLLLDPFGDISWNEAKQMMFDALAPLGRNYLAQVRKGLAAGWVDVFPNKGKRSGAYSWGSYGTHPYMFLNHTNNLNDVSTLVHEMGHSMHSFYSHSHQPYPMADYCIFTAEVASTTNEVLLLNYLIVNTKDRRKKLFLLNRRLENIRTTVYRQTMFASFEREVHKRAAEGGDTTADALQQLWYELNIKYYGPDIVIDEQLKMEWARIPHFYTPFYVYQYATGYSAATALAGAILNEGKTARDRYLKFLTKGGSNYPIELLKAAGADMSNIRPVEAVVRQFTETLDEIEKLF